MWRALGATARRSPACKYFLGSRIRPGTHTQEHLALAARLFRKPHGFTDLFQRKSLSNLGRERPFAQEPADAAEQKKESKDPLIASPFGEPEAFHALLTDEQYPRINADRLARQGPIEHQPAAVSQRAQRLGT